MKLLFFSDRLKRGEFASLRAREEFKSSLKKKGIICKIVDLKYFLSPKKYKFVEMYQHIRRDSPDFIMIDTIPLIGSFSLIMKLFKAYPLFVRLRGDFWKELQQQRIYHENSVSLVKNMARNVLGNLCLKYANAVFPVCNYLKDIGIKHNLPPEKLFTIYNGVDLDRFNLKEDGEIYRRKYGITDKKLLVCVSNFNFPEKVEGLIFFLPAIKRILNENPDVRFLIVGDGLFLNWVKGQIEKQKIRSQTIITGFVRDIERIYAAADIVLYLSFQDALPTVLLEASASGKPIVANKIGGVHEIIINQKTGILIDKYDREALYTHITRFLDNDPLRIKFGEMAQKSINTRFNWNVIGRQFADIFLKLMK